MSITGGLDLDLLSLQMQQKQSVQRKLAVDQVKKNLQDPNASDKKLRETCEGFESIFINQLWSQMRKTVPKEGYLHSKHEDMYLSMFDQEMSQKMAEAGGIGLGDILYRQLKEQTENASRYTSPSQALEPLPLQSLDAQPAASEQKIQTAPAPLTEAFAMDNFYTLASDPDETVTPEAAAPAVEKAVNAPVEHKVENLAEQIERVQGAVHNEGGPAPALEAPAIAPAEPWEAPIMRWPTDGQVSSGFGWRTDPFTGRREWHAGVDLAANAGSPVRACWPGKVVFSGDNGGYGNLVVLEHEGGWRSYYAHNRDNEVQVGDEVRAGKVIARIGSTGRSTGPHLHFEVRQGDQAWDPEMLQERLLAGLTVGPQSDKA